MSFHNRMMNIPNGAAFKGMPHGDGILYRNGHRDARHAAAEIALEADRVLDAAQKVALAAQQYIGKLAAMGEYDHYHDLQCPVVAFRYAHDEDEWKDEPDCRCEFGTLKSALLAYSKAKDAQ